MRLIESEPPPPPKLVRIGGMETYNQDFLLRFFFSPQTIFTSSSVLFKRYEFCKSNACNKLSQLPLQTTQNISHSDKSQQHPRMTTLLQDAYDSPHESRKQVSSTCANFYENDAVTTTLRCLSRIFSSDGEANDSALTIIVHT